MSVRIKREMQGKQFSSSHMQVVFVSSFGTGKIVLIYLCLYINVNINESGGSSNYNTLFLVINAYGF